MFQLTSCAKLVKIIEETRMSYFESLLTCSICESDLEFHGKEGVVLQTFCPGCGMNSEKLDPPEEEISQVEVYYSRKAPIANSK